MMRSVLLLTLAICPLTGCIERMLLDGTIKSTRTGAASFDKLGDYEVARDGAAAGLAQLEGFHQLAPENADALFMLTQSWAGYSSGFIEEEWERAQDRADDDAEAYHAARARSAYDRAIGYGVKWIEQKHPGFEAATRNSDTMAGYLKVFDAEEAPNLLWLGIAWLGRGAVAAEDPEVVANLFVGVSILERAVELDEKGGYGLGLAALGAYHARSPEAELEQARQLFERALGVTGRKALTVQVLYAQSFACNKHDRSLYEKLLTEVREANDPLPEQRLANVIAARRAERYLGKPRLARCGW